MTDELKDGMKRAREEGHRVVIAHNHPGSSAPSAADIKSLRNNGAAFGVIACHDGSILKFEQVKEPIGGYNSITKNRIERLMRAYGKDQEGLLKAYENELGVSVERFA